MSEAYTVGERYLSAATTSDLSLDPNMTCDADRLLAAAYATAGDPRRSLALDVWRIKATGSLSGVCELTEKLAKMVRTRDAHESDKPFLRKRRMDRDSISLNQARVVSVQMLKWWHKPSCPVCNGHGHPKMINAPVLDYTRKCHHCHGTGETPLERMVRPEYIEHARWLVSQFNALSSIIFDDMSRMLRPRFDL